MRYRYITLEDLYFVFGVSCLRAAKEQNLCKREITSAPEFVYKHAKISNSDQHVKRSHSSLSNLRSYCATHAICNCLQFTMVTMVCRAQVHKLEQNHVSTLNLTK